MLADLTTSCRKRGMKLGVYISPIDRNIAVGERVRSYVVDGMVNGTWQQLAAGSAVGHKKIDRIAPVAATRVRLRIPEAVGTPEIKRFAVDGAK